MPQPDPPATRPQPAKCFHCGYPRDPAPLQPCCPECGSEYPTDLEAEIRVLRSTSDLQRIRMVMLIAAVLGLPAALALAFPDATRGPRVILLGLAVYAGGTTLLGTMLAAAIMCLSLARGRKIRAAYQAATPATRARYDQARGGAQGVLLWLILAFILVVGAILSRVISSGWLVL